ncbi:MAG TPA: DUF5985 family protein [Acidimicrobiia bacterium]|nr:DUF5985 family protein [Acidimicrobiia bacterium]
MRSVLSGALAAGFVLAALHFARFWIESRDRLFLLFGAAFVLMAINSVALGLSTPEGDLRVVVYGLRLSAFVLILYAIYDKNRR